jgi:hypothetical protein
MMVFNFHESTEAQHRQHTLTLESWKKNNLKPIFMAAIGNWEKNEGMQKKKILYWKYHFFNF